MKICCIGCGYVGLVAATCLSDMGNDVICIDVDKNKINNLKKGIIPIYEPGLKDMLDRNTREKRIAFSTKIKEGIQNSEVIFIAVGTPPDVNNCADISAIISVAENIGQYMNGYKVIVNKSTAPVGTLEKIGKVIKSFQNKRIKYDLVSNPEFMREGEAIKDFTNPDRIVIGLQSEKAKRIMTSIYSGLARTDKPIMFTDIRSAELIKYASNAMLATRISFMNEMAQLCEKVGGDIKAIAKGIGLDSRIGPRFLQAGAGYGGSCFPKDVKALAEIMKANGIEAKILTAVDEVNELQKRSLIEKIKKLVPVLKGKNIAIWGLAFKPKTDDMREAPSILIIQQLQELGAKIKAFDPEAQETAKKILQDVTYCDDPYFAVKGCDALVIVTEWNEFRDLDLKKVKRLIKHPNIIDGRNIYEPYEMEKLGFNYICVGRKY
ncbi:MAG: UDP-glucose/GDP-mannose dehydrogenase family protein [Candidatus Brocadia sp. AMX2]|uniref:UDP-glucose 6-dehydrogenase n=1 Tax=Candidatus Brocadia sinica JPN1 TaxID=1197129 RepID=A0ABQ0K0I7_9BACT|nr:MULTISPECIES: UDP-glucose/GDP-mannose dehydrogenase family protein [Brocadia]MBC6933882.1 UDP-glucose/GDP-mannose dehydrogenase family protein [Candidatus Brocadia sp.]MBL1170596.1 UDP-glucose/GDP-mannose dehydrogenase family protein [Candidatus Brocadia sp. AMX1]MCK6469815.1 UDP-glucose/GDP-mannose dehydrogenase family protein [Candidatus Brocadia sinica]NOG42337.1 UDP-glucose/GDP-mannose dehydrogenase family protein [Planctomycetota bacterium]KAA0242321.1 MAG: UDP-glucose/GDP-mannose dehy